MNNYLKLIERQNSILLLSLPFLLSTFVIFGLPDAPLKDERFFFPLIQKFGESYFPSLSDIRQMTQPQGPVYFAVFGFVGHFFDYSLLPLRLLNVFLGFLGVLFLYKTLSQHTQFPLCLSLWFTLNPYFLLLTTPYIYTDNLCMLFVLAGMYFFVVKENRFAAGVLWGLALWTRQVAIIVPLSAVIVDLYFTRTDRCQQFKVFLGNALPFLALLVLFVTWDFSLTPPNNVHNINTVDTFRFSLRQLNYAIVLTGVYSAPIWLPKIRLIVGSRMFILASLCGFSLITHFPRLVNQDSPFYSVWTAGYFDKFLLAIGNLAYVIVPILWLPALAYFLLCLRPPWTSRIQSFAIGVVFLFFAFETVFTFAWDKYFILVIPFALLTQISRRTCQESTPSTK